MNKSSRQIVLGLKSMDRTSEDLTSEVDVEGMWRRFRERNTLEIKKPWGRWTAGIGALTTACLLGFLAVEYNFVERDNHPSTSDVRSYSTRPGQLATITLEDGSTAVLAPVTTLNVSGRYVKLTGQALFTVRSNVDSPFMVEANNQITRVLGTTFSVRSYPGDTAVWVAVRDGKVSVAKTILVAKDVAGISTGATTVLHNQSLDTEFAFASGKLVLTGTPLRLAIPELERWFDGKINVSDPSLLDVRIKGTFAGGSMTALADILGPTLNVRAVYSGRTLTLYPKG